MYARVGAPSKGPRRNQTDVTDASAQNGMEMKFYQEGLDWKPRNISRNGSEIPQAQMGTMVTPLDFSKPLGTLEGVSEVMSAPARTATYLLTGKYQDPSQALGIKNPIGAFVTDAILDPVNLIGIGAARKVAKAATKAGVKAISPELSDLKYVTKRKPYQFDASKIENLSTKEQKKISEFVGRTMDAFIDNAEKEAYKRYGTYKKDPITGKLSPVLKGDMYMDMMMNLPDVNLVRRNKEGGVIKDDMGQWAHPGEITEIQGNTMVTHGYGDIPLWVEPNVGEPRLVQPNTGTHKFPGATKFKETPVSKKWLEKYK